MLHYLWLALLGLLAGAIAKFIMPGKDPGGIIVTMIIGILGSYVGNYIGGMLGLSGGDGIMGFVWAVVGALILLFIWKKLLAPMFNKEA